MTRAEHLLKQLHTHFDGEPWHGSALRRLLDDISAETAHRRPLRVRRSIAELLAHIIAWYEIVDRRLAGEAVEPTAEIVSPSVDGVAWGDQIDHLERAHQQLCRRIVTLNDDALDAIVPGRSYTAAFMIDGLMHHNTYHGGQIALLKE